MAQPSQIDKLQNEVEKLQRFVHSLALRNSKLEQEVARLKREQRNHSATIQQIAYRMGRE